MKTGSLLGGGFTSNECFDAASSRNRDDCLLPFIQLRQALLSRGLALNTDDLNHGKAADFVIHLDAGPSIGEMAGCPAYVLAFENPFINPFNADPWLLAKADRVLTWNTDLLSLPGAVRTLLPNPRKTPPVDGWTDRPLFASMICGNKSLPRPDPRDLYGERIATVRWYERHQPEHFRLFGIGWDRILKGRGIAARAERLARTTAKRWLGRPLFPSHGGTVDTKASVLRASRFSYCYENTGGLPNYVTEKLFDAFFSGSVPVYWGASDISDHVPADCFIDRRQFKDTAQVHAHLQGIDQATFRAYQERMRAFVTSARFDPFCSLAFAENTASLIAADLAPAQSPS